MLKRGGPLLIMLAAALWALDALIRTQLTFVMPSGWIVFFEHLVGVIVLLPLIYKSRQAYAKLSKRDWLFALALTVCSSVLGTILFTEALARSFAIYDFATPILLQKLQPVFVVVLSALFLREKINLRFAGLAVIALIGSYMISFGAGPVDTNFQGKSEVVLLAVLAAAAWGSGTILSKKLLGKLSFAQATGLRFTMAVPASLLAVLILGQALPAGMPGPAELLRFLMIAFSTGAAAILLYYRGLATTPAKVATFAELTFPVVSILIAISTLNPYGSPQQLSLANVFGIIILLIAILQISTEDEKS